MRWEPQRNGAFWYTVLADAPTRLGCSIFRRSREHAEETAAALNRIDVYHETPTESVPA
jgi:hypothetical protein